MDNFDHNENTLSGKGSNHDTTLIFQVGCGLSETKVKLAKVAQIRPVESLIKNYTTIKSYKITAELSNISIFLIKKFSLIRVFIQSRCNCACLVPSDVFRRDFSDKT